MLLMNTIEYFKYIFFLLLRFKVFSILKISYFLLKLLLMFFQVVLRYAIQNPLISFGCKKVGVSSSDIQTQKNSTSTSVIRLLFGNEVAQSLIEFHLTKESLANNQSLAEIGFHAQGLISSPNFHRRKGTFILFINNRLVDSSAIKKGVYNVYQNYLPKHTHPFVYLSIYIDPPFIDVNVHPTKKVVHFIKESEIIATLQNTIQKTLLGPSSSRTYKTYISTPTALSSFSNRNDDASFHETTLLSTKKTEETFYQHQKVRTDSLSQTLEAFIAPPTHQSPGGPIPQLSASSAVSLYGKRPILALKKARLIDKNIDEHQNRSDFDISKGENSEMLTSISNLLSKLKV